jgi:hypothetical protein
LITFSENSESKSLSHKDNLDNTQNSAIFEQSEDVQTSTEIDSTKNHEDSIKQLPNRDIIPPTNEKSSTSEMQDLVDSMINQSDVYLQTHLSSCLSTNSLEFVFIYNLT